MADATVEPTTEQCLRLAARGGVSAWDAEFVFVAEALGLPLVTADKRLARAFPGRVVSLEDSIRAATKFLVDPGNKDIHLSAFNLRRTVLPQGGSTAAETLQRNADAIRAAGGTASAPVLFSARLCPYPL